MTLICGQRQTRDPMEVEEALRKLDTITYLTEVKTHTSNLPDDPMPFEYGIFDDCGTVATRREPAWHPVPLTHIEKFRPNPATKTTYL